MPHSRDLNRISVEEKGQMAQRRTNPYISDMGFPEVTVCGKCGAQYFNKRWYLDEEEIHKSAPGEPTNTVTCPACLRIQDNNPEGVVTLSGSYLMEHEDEILNIIKNSEEKARKKNPLARIMEIRQENDVVTISTTDDKLAQRLGRDVHKAHKGDLHYSWGREENFVRVDWQRLH